MKNRIINTVIVYIFLQYIVYDLWGNQDYTLWLLYYWVIPVVVFIYLLFVEILKPIGRYLRIYSIVLILITIYHYLRLTTHYSEHVKDFMGKLEDSKPVYYTTIVWLGLSIIVFLYFKLKKWSKKKKLY